MAQIRNINTTEFVGLEGVALIGLKNGQMVRTTLDNKFVSIDEKDKLVNIINEHSAHITVLEEKIKVMEKTIAELQTKINVAKALEVTSVENSAETVKTTKKSKKASE